MTRSVRQLERILRESLEELDRAIGRQGIDEIAQSAVSIHETLGHAGPQVIASIDRDLLWELITATHLARTVCDNLEEETMSSDVTWLASGIAFSMASMVFRESMVFATCMVAVAFGAQVHGVVLKNRLRRLQRLRGATSLLLMLLPIAITPPPRTRVEVSEEEDVDAATAAHQADLETEPEE